VIAFDAGQQELMLNAAWADSQGVPERRHRRFHVDLPVHFSSGEAEGMARLFNLSRGGAGLMVDARLRSGSPIQISCAEFTAAGRVRWVSPHSHQVGVEFLQFHDELIHSLAPRPAPQTKPACTETTSVEAGAGGGRRRGWRGP